MATKKIFLKKEKKGVRVKTNFMLEFMNFGGTLRYSSDENMSTCLPSAKKKQPIAT